MPLQAREESSAYMTMSKKTNLQQRQIRKWAVMTNRNNAWGKKNNKKNPKLPSYQTITEHYCIYLHTSCAHWANRNVQKMPVESGRGKTQGLESVLTPITT